MEAEYRDISLNQLKKWAGLAETRGRRGEGLFIAEGVKVVDELLKSGRPVEAFLVMPEKKPYWEKVVASAEREIPVYQAGQRQWKKISQDKEPEGLMAVVKKEKEMTLASFLDSVAGSLLILHEINNPSNLGALARSACWFGFGGIIISRNSVDWTNPRAIRASMGSIFHLDILADVDLADAMAEIRKNRPVIGSDAGRGEAPHPVEKDAALLLGSESHGLPQHLLAPADEKWRIPGGGKIQSLSLPQAAAIMMYEMVKKG